MEAAHVAAVAHRGRGRVARPRAARVVVLKEKQTISLEQAIHREIWERAQREGTTFSDVVEGALREYLAKAAS